MRVGRTCGRYAPHVCLSLCFPTFCVPWRGASAPALLPVAACLGQEGPSARAVGRVLQQPGFSCDDATATRMKEEAGGQPAGRRRPCCHCSRREKPGGGGRDQGSSSSDVSACRHGVKGRLWAVWVSVKGVRVGLCVGCCELNLIRRCFTTHSTKPLTPHTQHSNTCNRDVPGTETILCQPAVYVLGSAGLL